MAYTNSPMVVCTNLSPNHSGQRTHAIDRITPHCVVGQCTAEGLGSWFAKTTTQASSNYGIDRDGRVGMYVEEKNRSWCSSSNENDQRAVTIECASDTSEPYAFNDVVYRTLIDLCADICRRNGKTKLLWIGDKAKTLSYTPAADEMVLTVHRWFAAKSCPGAWMYERMGDLADEVTAILAKEEEQDEPGTKPEPDYCEVSVPILRKGDTGTAVRSAQALLIARGCYCGGRYVMGREEPDGIFGPVTEKTVMSLQALHRLEPDGVIGSDTWTVLLT